MKKGYYGVSWVKKKGLTDIEAEANIIGIMEYVINVIIIIITVVVVQHVRRVEPAKPSAWEDGNSGSEIPPRGYFHLAFFFFSTRVRAGGFWRSPSVALLWGTRCGGLPQRTELVACVPCLSRAVAPGAACKSTKSIHLPPNTHAPRNTHSKSQVPPRPVAHTVFRGRGARPSYVCVYTRTLCESQVTSIRSELEETKFNFVLVTKQTNINSGDKINHCKIRSRSGSTPTGRLSLYCLPDGR